MTRKYFKFWLSWSLHFFPLFPFQNLSEDAVNESRQHVDAFKEKYEYLQAEDKVLDKNFKKDFSDVPAVQADQLYRLFRRRPRFGN